MHGDAWYQNYELQVIDKGEMTTVKKKGGGGVIPGSFPCSICLTPERVQRGLYTKIGIGIWDFHWGQIDYAVFTLSLLYKVYVGLFSFSRSTVARTESRRRAVYFLKLNLRTRCAHGGLSIECKGYVLAYVSHEEKVCKGSILSP